MAWQRLAELELSEVWKFTQNVQADYIRIQFAGPINANGRIYVCQTDGLASTRQIFQIKRLYPKVEAEILYLPQPYCFEARAFGFRARILSPLASWSLTIDYWDEIIPT
ncbi:MAG: hypothetical protein ACPL4I_11160 [Bacteroidota bacterium]|jgi:hypothetical protein